MITPSMTSMPKLLLAPKRKDVDPMHLNHKHRLLILPSLALLVSLLVSGCAKDLVVEDFGKIEKGMTLDEVVALLGEGTEATSAEVESRFAKFEEIGQSAEPCETWMQWGNRKALGFVGFKDGKVKEIMLD